MESLSLLRSAQISLGSLELQDVCVVCEGFPTEA